MSIERSSSSCTHKCLVSDRHGINSKHRCTNWSVNLLDVSGVDFADLDYRPKSFIPCKCWYAFDRIQSATLPMQILQSSSIKKKSHRDLHADSRLPSFNSFCTHWSVSCRRSGAIPRPTKAFIVPCRACLWFLRNLGSVPFRDGYRWVLGFLMPFLWAFFDLVELATSSCSCASRGETRWLCWLEFFDSVEKLSVDILSSKERGFLRGFSRRG